MKTRTKLTAILLSLVLCAGILASCAKSGDGDASPTPSAGADVTTPGATAPDNEAAYLAEPASQRVIKIGYSGGLCQAAVAIAQLKGYFADEGLNTELTKVENARDAIATGHLDTSAGMIAYWLTPVTNGIDIRFTVGLHTGCSSAFVTADSGITEFTKGQRVAVSGGFGGVNNNIAYRFISHDGFVPDDFTWLAFDDDNSALIALTEGKADVAVIGDQVSEKEVQNGSIVRIRSLHEDDDFKDEACCVMGISGAFLDENPVASEKISRAVYKAALWIDANEENKIETAKLLLENGYISGTEEYAVHLLGLFRFGLPNELTEATLYRSVDEYQKLGVISADLNPDDVKAQIWVPLNIG
ncbi:MAG: ABC transporter substrate-binding protein [Oscillospiraceae bacterium]|jgi:NitT/TauT family transport system substrate-binding protein|nr:ABC transporter substrate-binding protein [Oscillospiraceae bacterium]